VLDLSEPKQSSKRRFNWKGNHDTKCPISRLSALNRRKKQSVLSAKKITVVVEASAVSAKTKKKVPAGCVDLNPKFHDWIKDAIKRLNLPTPDSPYGFSSRLLENSLPPSEYLKFGEWMDGQTCMLDEKLGVINYTHDVIRGIDLIRNKKPTYWD
jgi:hypothetical protein